MLDAGCCQVHERCFHREMRGDYNGWQVVAPVREAAAQALGAAIRPLPSAKLEAVVSHLCRLVGQPEWEVRLGGLLGIKYLLAARPDCCDCLLREVLPSVLVGLQVTCFCRLCNAMHALQPCWSDASCAMRLVTKSPEVKTGLAGLVQALQLLQQCNTFSCFSH